MVTESTSLSEQATGLKAQLQSMDDYAFEKFVADLWEQRGFSTQVSQEAVDAGIDVVASKQSPYPQKELIQAKRYKEGNTVGGPAIQQYASLKHQEENVDSVVVVTTSSFSRHARERAEELNVKLVDGDQLIRLVTELGAQDLVSKYGIRMENETVDTRKTSRRKETEIEAGFPLIAFLACSCWMLFWLIGSELQIFFGFVGWLLLPVGVYFDAHKYSENKSAIRLYTIGAAIPFLGYFIGLYYLSLRLR